MAGELWILAETRNDEPTRATVQVVSGARRMADGKGIECLAVLAGGARPAAEAVAKVAGRVLWLNQEALGAYDAQVLCGALAALVAHRGAPRAILAPLGARTAEVLPRLAAVLDGTYAGSCVDLRFEGVELVVRRPVFGGKVYEELAFDRGPVVITVRPGSFEAAAALDGEGAVEEVGVELPAPSGVEVVSREACAAASVDLADAGSVVAGGRGVAGAFFGLVEDLADALGGAAAASRALVDAGERPHEQQVGKSGKTVSPELYIACGISGAIHHTLGMNTAKVVVAINSDPNAPIFRVADYGLVGDAAKIIPELVAAIGKAEG